MKISKALKRKLRNIALKNGQPYHLVAILRRNKSIIKVGTNTSKTSPEFTRCYHDGSLGHHMHAEMSVLSRSRPGDWVQVCRFVRSSDDYVMAKPCEYCVRFMKQKGISIVKYTNEYGNWEDISL